jgi:nucleotide-binding universal stress UspA family protein
MSVFDTIIWATDGSDLDHQTLGCVRDLSDHPGTSLLIVYVARGFGGQPSVPAEGGREERRIAGLKARTSALRRHGINASLHVIRGAYGPPSRPIADLAEAVHADLMIVGGRARSVAADLAPGSVTPRLIARAPCPVLVVPERPGVPNLPPVASVSA